MNGWWPQLHVHSGVIWLAHGNGESNISRVNSDGQIDGTTHLGNGSSSGQWIRPGVMTYWKSVGPDVNERWEHDVTTGASVVAQAATRDTGGNMQAAGGGRWITQMAGRLEIDGRVRRHGVGFPVAAGGSHVAYLSDGSQAWIVREDSDSDATFQALTPLHQMAMGPDGSLVYGGYGRVFGIDPVGNQVDLTIAPDGVEFIGAGGAPMPTATCWVGQDGRRWLATSLSSGGQFGVALRPWGDTAALFIPADADQISVVEHEGRFFVATCNTRGQLVMYVAPLDATRAPLKPAPHQEPPPPPPPPPPPDDEENDTMPSPDESAIYQRLVELRQFYPQAPEVVTNDQCVEMLNRVAWHFRDEGVGLLEKTGGNRGRRSDGKECSVDYLVHGTVLADVIKDAGGNEAGGFTKPVEFSWRPMNPSDGETPDRFVAPIPFSGGVVEPPPPPPPPGDVAELRAAVEALTARVGRQEQILGEQVAALQDAIAGANDGIESLGGRVQRLETGVGGQMPAVHGTVSFSFFGLNRSFPATFTPERKS